VVQIVITGRLSRAETSSRKERGRKRSSAIVDQITPKLKAPGMPTAIITNLPVELLANGRPIDISGRERTYPVTEQNGTYACVDDGSSRFDRVLVLAVWAATRPCRLATGQQLGRRALARVLRI
jgi:hypothetical protein